MTNIGFYKISGSQQDALLFACQLSEKVFRQAIGVLIHTNDLAETEQLDSLLWIYAPQSFLPHSTEVTTGNMIAISHEDQPGEHHGLLINLTDRVPGWFSRFERTAEIVYDDHTVIEKKREHFKFYKDRGYPIQYHDLGKK